MDKATVESVMALAFELARIREQHGAQSGMYLSEVRALRAEVERLAAQAAPSVDSWTREDVDEVISCLEDDSAALKNENEEDERAANMDRAGSMLAWMLLTHPVYRAQPSQAPVVQAAPVNCGTGYCSCIECVVEPEAVLAREYPPLPDPNMVSNITGLVYFGCDQMRAYVDADRASSGATTQAVRMLTVPTVEQKQATEALGTLSTISDGDVKECVRVLRQYVEQSSRAARMLKEGEIEDVLRMPVYSPSIIPIYMQMAVELQRKFCAVNAGRTIPADGVIGGAA